MYISKDTNKYYLKYAIIAIIIGTIMGDYLMFYTINKSSKVNLPIAISLIHLAPIFSLFLVYFYYKKRLPIGSIFGIIIAFIGIIISIYFSNV
jgi:drug/metabolite transporter (DMT)-like permease